MERKSLVSLTLSQELKTSELSEKGMLKANISPKLGLLCKTNSECKGNIMEENEKCCFSDLTNEKRVKQPYY